MDKYTVLEIDVSPWYSQAIGLKNLLKVNPKDSGGYAPK